jgi:tetratricopeptide (TPR) repeat protein
MSQIAIDRWERGFRAAAKADGYKILGDHLRRLELPDFPELLLEGTILAVRACCAYMDIDGLDRKYLRNLLEMQQYDPADSTDARYAVTFDISGTTYARVLVEPGLRSIDLADLYGQPWWEYETAGYDWLCVSSIDWSELTSEDLRRLEGDVEYDLRFDYCDEEVDFWFDRPPDKTCLWVCVYDVEEETQTVIERLDEAIDQDPSDPDLFIMRGDEYEARGDLNQSIQDYTIAIRLDPESARAYSHRALACAGLRQYQRTIEDLDEAIGLDPGRASAYTNRGNAYSALGQPERAIKDHDRAILLDSMLAGAYINRGNAYAKLGLLAQAIEDYDEAIRLNPQDAQAYVNRGLEYFKLDQPALAGGDSEEAIKLDPENAMAYGLRGVANRELGHHEQAVQDMSEAVRLNPNDNIAYNHRGIAYFWMGQLEEAIGDYDEAIRLDSGCSEAYFNRGLAFYGLGHRCLPPNG